MTTPTVREIVTTPTRTEHDPFIDGEPTRRPRMTPYHRPSSQRELVRMSLDLYSPRDTYVNRKRS